MKCTGHLGDGSCPFYAIVNCISLNCFKPGFFDQADQFCSRHLYFIIGFN